MGTNENSKFRVHWNDEKSKRKKRKKKEEGQFAKKGCSVEPINKNKRFEKRVIKK